MRHNRWMLWLILPALFFSCRSQEKPSKQIPTMLRVAYPSTVGSLDPLSENTLISGSIYINIYESLVGRTSGFQFQPALALRWSTPNDRTWIFELRRGVVFHDGTPFTADDVLFTFDRIKASSAQQSSALAVVEKVEAPDPHTVRVITFKPCSYLLSRIYGLVIVPRKFLASGSKGIIPGTGPYQVRTWEPGKYVHLEASASYWGDKPGIREVRFEAIADADESARQLLHGDIDVLPQLDPAALDKLGLSGRKGIVIRNYPGLMVLYLGFDTMHTKLPGSTLSANPFRDKRVRQAVYQAINTDRLIRDIQKGYAIEATQLTAPPVYGYNRDIRRLAYDPAAARRLLAEAGHLKGFAVRLDLPNNRYRSEVEVGKAIAEDLAAIGIQVELNAEPKEEWLKLREEGQTPFFLAGWGVASGDASGTLDYLIHTPETSGYGRANSGGYSNPEVDRIIEQSGQEADPKKRKELLEKAIAMAMEDVVAVPLYVEQNLAAHRATLQWDPRPDEIIVASTISPTTP